MKSDQPGNLPLAGVTVIALEQAVAAPFATRQLADLGARVIKIERPRVGDFARYYDKTARGLSSHFVWLNRSKESLTLDVKHPEGKGILLTLLASADVFVQNLGPGAVERLGLHPDGLRRDNPGLIVCNISGYGCGGPYRTRKAYDALVQAETGLLSITGTEETPSKAGIAVADIAAGMYAYSGILTALLVRTNTGAGTVLDVSLFEALAEWMGYPAYYAMGGGAPRRTGSSHATIAPYGLYPAGEGGMIMLSIQNEREWRLFSKVVLRQPDLADDPRFADNDRRVQYRAVLRGIIEATFEGLPVQDLIARLDEAQIAYAQARTMAEFLDHPQLSGNHRWRTVDSPAGPLPALIPPVTMAGMEPRLESIPALGAHTKQILASIGYSETRIEELRALGVV